MQSPARLRRSPLVLLTLASILSVACSDDAGSTNAAPSDSGGMAPSNSGGSGGGTPSSSGGSGATAAGGSGPNLEPNATAPERAGFSLLFHDDFDALDTARWMKASHTFTENAAQFDPNMVTVSDGALHLRIEKADTPSAEGKTYRGGELRTQAFFSYGRFETRARFASGSGLVSSLFTYYDHWADAALEENWNEIDIEFLGKDPTSVQFNVIHWNAADVRTTHEQHATLDFDPSADFHVYAIEWLPEEVNFYVDEELVHTQTDQVAEFLTLDSRLMLNAWPVEDTANLTGWAGAVDDAALPAEATYDWVRAYEYVGN